MITIVLAMKKIPKDNTAWKGGIENWDAILRKAKCIILDMHNLAKAGTIIEGSSNSVFQCLCLSSCWH
jgi:hypothetical protein